MTRDTIAIWGAGALVGLFALAACDDDDGYCQGTHCRCGGRPDCDIGCVLGGCDVACASADRCRTGCTDACDVACNDVSQCDNECGDDCQLACTRASDCGFSCGDRCDVRCADVSQCQARVGADSQVECMRLDNCAVECTGPCSVSCAQVSRCEVTCAPGLARCEQAGEVRCAERC